jgi:ATP-dependent Clp protease protease subunit
MKVLLTKDFFFIFVRHQQNSSAMLNKDEFRKYAVKGQGISGSNIDSYFQRVENMTRSVIEERPTNFREIDVFSRLMMDRIIFLGMQVDDNIANIITAQLLFLESADPKKDVLLYINSPGGSVYAGLGIYDTMQYISPDVATICTGLAASMGAVLLAGGAAKKRSSLPHSRIMIHQPLGGAQGQASDIEITARQILQLKKELYEIIAQHTGKSYEQIERDSDRDYWLRAEEAKEYGLIDEVLIREKKND